MSPYYYRGTIKAEDMTREQAIEAYIGMCRQVDAILIATVRAFDMLPEAMKSHPDVKALYAASEAKKP